MFETLIGYRKLFGNENYQIVLDAIRDNKDGAKDKFLALITDKYPFLDVDISKYWDKLISFNFGDNPIDEFTEFIKGIANLKESEMTEEQEEIIQHMDNPEITQDTDEIALMKMAVAYLGAFNEVSSAIAQGILEGKMSEEVITAMEEALPILTEAVKILNQNQ